MDKRKFNGGSRKGAGRKKGSGLSGKIKSYVDDFMLELLKDNDIKNQINRDLKQMSFTSGYIYIIKDVDTGNTKIGVTQKPNPKSRLSQYSSHKINYELIFIDEVEYCFDIENEIHILNENKRIKGDWFDMNKIDVLNSIKIINKHKYKKYYNG